MMDPFKAEAIRVALKRMFGPGRYFCICTVRDCLRAASVDPPKDAMEELAPLHCVHWSEMSPEMRTEVQHRTLALFSHPSIDFGDLDTPQIGPAAQPTSLFRRLLGKGAADA